MRQDHVRAIALSSEDPMVKSHNGSKTALELLQIYLAVMTASNPSAVSTLKLGQAVCSALSIRVQQLGRSEPPSLTVVLLKILQGNVGLGNFEHKKLDFNPYGCLRSTRLQPTLSACCNRLDQIETIMIPST